MNQMARLVFPAPEIPRLGIPKYSWYDECLSGDVHAGNATSFPEEIGIAATFNPNLVFQLAEATAKELRAKNNYFEKHGIYGEYKGLSCFSPLINIMRDPRWGRNMETYGEDPYVAGRMSASFVQGLQGQHPRYIRANAGCKHLDAYAGPENIPMTRYVFNAVVSERDWRLTFVPAFKACVAAGTYSVMCAYNSFNGVPSCANTKLMGDFLRGELGFTGYVVSDQEAVEYVVTQHKYYKNNVDGVAGCLNAGCSIDLSESSNAVYLSMLEAYKQGKITKKTMLERVRPLFYTRMRLGEFDPPEMNPYKSLDMSIIQSKEHVALAVYAATQSYVLMKNLNGLLPLNKQFSNIAVVGPMADNVNMLYGDYAPTIMPGTVVTPLEGLRQLSSNVNYGAGCNKTHCDTYNPDEVKNAVADTQLVIVCLGTGTDLESEMRDRTDLALPGKQLQLLQDAVKYADGAPVILLLFNAGPLDISWAKESPRVQAIMECYYPAQTAGEAIYRVITNQDGKYSPAARLPYTWYKSVSQIPPITNYTMEDRTYRYMKPTTEPLYPFGYGLSYSRFQYLSVFVQPTIHFGQQANIAVSLMNMGPVDAEEVIQVYLSWANTTQVMPRLQLVDYRRVPMRNQLTWEFYLHIKPDQMKVWHDDKGFIFEQGTMVVYVGGQQPNQKTSVGSNVLRTSFELIP